MRSYFTLVLTSHFLALLDKISGVKPQVMNRHFFITNASAWQSCSKVLLFFLSGFKTDNVVITGVIHHSQECMGVTLCPFSSKGTCLPHLCQLTFIFVFAWNLNLKRMKGCFSVERHAFYLSHIGCHNRCQKGH